MKIKILYSHLNTSGKDYKYRPFWFDFEKCFKNLLTTSEGMEIHVIYDITRGDIEYNWMNKYKDHYILHKIQGGSMERAAIEMYKIAKGLSEGMKDNDLFYFLENDYLHVKGWPNKILELFDKYSNLNYVTLYDHGDKYFHPAYDDLVSKIFTSDTHHWRTIISTCGSYITNKKIFLEDYKDLTTVVGDHNKWIYLNETKDRFILSAVPGLSTHCMETLLSPTIDWEKINNETLI